jgi:hypothetical protein
MVFSWLLNRLGYSKSDIKDIFYKSMFPNHFFKNNGEKLNRIKQFNQIGLGRKLRKEEQIALSIDQFFVTIYQEFGESVFSPEIFASVITNYLNILFELQNCPPDCQKVNIIFDNDQDKEEFGSVSYYQFAYFTDQMFHTGCFKGQDKEIWLNMSQEEKLNLILTCLKFSPVLIETPGHALVLSGYSSTTNLFTINDSLNEGPIRVKEVHLLNKLTTIVMYFNLPV